MVKMKIEDTSLSAMTKKALTNAGITTAEELLDTSEDQISKIRDIGMKSFKEIIKLREKIENEK